MTLDPSAKGLAYRWRLVPASEFSRHAQAWESILAQSATSPLLKADFIHTLLAVFGDGDELLAICGDPSEPYAMCILKRVGTGVWGAFQASQGPLSAWIHRRGVEYKDVLPTLIGVLPGLPLVIGITQKDPDLRPRPEDTATLKALDYVSTGRVLVNRSFEKYWQERDKKVRYEIRRRLKRLAEIGIQPRLEVVRDSSEVPAAIEAYCRIEASGWKGEAGTAVRGDNQQGVFYERLMADNCARGKGRIYRYCFGDKVVAMQLCIDDAGSLVFLKTAYDEDYARYSPGILMKYAIFEHIFNEGTLAKIEFYGALIEWQGKWIDEVRTLYHVTYYRWAWLSNTQERRRAARIKRFAEATDARQAAHGASEAPAYVVHRYDDLASLPDHCQALFARLGDANLFFTLPWYRNLNQSVLTPEQRLRIYAVDTGEGTGATHALLLMQYQILAAGWRSARRLSGLSNYYSSLFGPVIEPDAADPQVLCDTLAAAIAADEPRWDVIDLHPLEFDTTRFPALAKALGRAGYLVYDYLCFGNWFLQVRGRSYAEYHAALPSQLRNTLKRKNKQFEKSPQSKIVVYRDEAGLDEAMRAYEQIYASSWKVPEPYPEFIRGLCRACASAGWLRLGVAYVDGQPAAAQIWIVLGGIANIYKLAYDERFAKLSLGSILTAHLMEQAIDVDKVREVDYLTGDDAYKRDWMSDRRERRGIVAFNPRSPRGLLAAALHLGGRAARRALAALRRLRGGTA